MHISFSPMATDCLFTPAHHLGTFELMKCDIRTDQAVGPHPPILRVLRHVADALKAAGQNVVDWEPPLQTTAKWVHVSPLLGSLQCRNCLTADRQQSGMAKVSFLLADGGNDIHPLIPDLQESFQLKAAD